MFCIGVGNDVDRGLLQQIAQDTGGLAAFVSRQDNFERQAAAFRRKLMRPVATDVQVQISGVEAYDLEPKQLPNLYHGMPVRLYGRYKGSGEAKVSVRGKVIDKPIEQSVTMSFPKQDDDNPQIERMWAWHRVDRLLNVADAGGSRTAVLDEIVRLGEGYSIATEYTSFIVLENDGEYQRWKIDRRNVLRTERDRSAQQKVAKQLEALRSKTTVALGPIDPDAAPKVDAPVRHVVDNRPQTSARPAPAPAPAQPNRNSRDFNIPSGGGRGGGAIDPVTGAIVLGLAAAAIVAQRRARGSRTEPRVAA